MISIERATNGEFFVRLKSPNGNKIVNTETYKDKRSAVRAVRTISKIVSRLITGSGVKYSDNSLRISKIKFA